MSDASLTTRVLIVEDDVDIADAIRDHLARADVASEHAADARTARGRILQGGIDLVLLDIMLPDSSGLEVCRALRNDGCTIPVIFLTAKSQEDDLIRGLEAGGDDYVTKPFSANSLVARVKAHTRRWNDYRAESRTSSSEHSTNPASLSDESAQQIITLGTRTIDFAAGEIRRDNDAIDMTAKEHALLSVLVRRPNAVLTRDRLFAEVWGNEHFGDPGTVAVHIRRLREKLEDDPSSPKYLQTVRGLGYRFRPESNTGDQE